MSNSYTINSTDGSLVVTIQPGTFNGNTTGSADQTTDLLLYGRGSFNWGAGIEQNLIRLTENWASLAENPTAATQDQHPKVYAANTNTGITKPMLGQIWYNKSNNRVYICTDPTITGGKPTGTWRVDSHGRYLPLTGGQISGDVNIQTTSPDLFLTATNVLGNSHLVFRTTDASSAIIRTGLFYADQGTDTIRLRKYDQVTGVTLQSELQQRDDTFLFSHDVRQDGTSPITPDTNNSFVTNGHLSSEYLPLAGGTMSGDLRIENNGPQITLANETGSASEVALNFNDQTNKKFTIKMKDGPFVSPSIAFDTSILPIGRDTVLFEKYNGAGAVINTIVMLDTHIETFDGAAGKIRTPLTVMGDDDTTLTTLGTIKTNFRQKKSDVLVEKTAEGTIEMRSATGNHIKLQTLTGATQDSRITFTNPVAGQIAYIGAKEEYPVPGEDTLVLQKTTGSVVQNFVEIHSDKTITNQDFSIETDDVALPFEYSIRRDGKLATTVASGVLTGSAGYSTTIANHDDTTGGIDNQVSIRPTFTSFLKSAKYDFFVNIAVDDDDKTLTSKEYVDEFAGRRIYGQETQVDRTFIRYVPTTGEWRTGKLLTGNSGALLTGTDLYATIAPAPSLANYHIRPNQAGFDDSVSVMTIVSFECSYVVDYTGGAEQYPLFTGMPIRYNVQGTSFGGTAGPGLWVTIPNDEMIHVNLNERYQTGRIAHKFAIQHLPGQTVLVGLGLDSFGPVHEVDPSTTSIGGFPPQAHLDNFDRAILTNIKWSWEK